MQERFVSVFRAESEREIVRSLLIYPVSSSPLALKKKKTSRDRMTVAMFHAAFEEGLERGGGRKCIMGEFAREVLKHKVRLHHVLLCRKDIEGLKFRIFLVVPLQGGLFLLTSISCMGVKLGR